MAFDTVLELFNQRNETTSSVYYASNLRKATLLLDMKEYDACISLCQTVLTSLRGLTTYDDDELPTPKETIESVLMLYLAECYLVKQQFDVKFTLLN